MAVTVLIIRVENDLIKGEKMEVAKRRNCTEQQSIAADGAGADVLSATTDTNTVLDWPTLSM